MLIFKEFLKIFYVFIYVLVRVTLEKVSSLKSGHGILDGGAEVARLADEGRGRPGVGRGGERQGGAQHAHQGEGEEEAAKRRTRFVF